MSQPPPSATLDFNALAQYGDRLVERLAKRLTALEIPGCDRRNLYRYREFLQSYPQIVGTLSPQFAPLLVSVPFPDARDCASTVLAGGAAFQPCL